MRYRRLSSRYTIAIRSGQTWPFGDVWASERLRRLTEVHWRPDADTYETATSIEITVDLAGVGEDDFEVQLFEDALIIEGRRQLPSCHEGAVYHTVGIRQGPFRLALPLPAAVEPEGIEARYERGLLRVTLVKTGPGAG
jgi:HSP20 family molecular chaperone IbpA